MNYEYSGYLSTILSEPDSEIRDKLDCIEFGPTELADWHTEDLSQTLEWRQVPVKKSIGEGCIRIEGDFRGVVPIESLSADDPRYWVPLSTINLENSPLPIDVSIYPIIEITYRCTSEHAHPTWMWTYQGGSHLGALPKSTEWRTVARIVQHFGFPSTVDNVILRLYSPQRTVESIEFASIRFRAMSPAETQALQKSQIELEQEKELKSYPILDSFMPLGVYMDADSAKRLAAMLGISTSEYWDLALEDIVEHNHNTIALAHADQLSHDEWSSLLALAEDHGIKFIPRHDFPLGGSAEEQEYMINKHVKPYAESDGIFARTFRGEPIENDFRQVIAAKKAMEKGDPNHPVAIIARYPNAYPLFAPFFSASGVGYFYARRPWDLGASVREHVGRSNARQFWVAAPAFIYPTQTPEWSTSPEMRLMVNLAIANGTRGWLAYSYHNDPLWLRGRIQRTLTGPFLTFSDIWLELKQNMKRVGSLAPIYLDAKPVDEPEAWFVQSVKNEEKAAPFPGVPPISLFQLSGSDYSLYIVVSNNVRDMTGVDFSFPSDLGGIEIYDMNDYVRTGQWQPFPRDRHTEMFPGQAITFLAASQERCDYWRDVVAERLIDHDFRRLQYNLKLARTYGIDTAKVEKVLKATENGSATEHLAKVHFARGDLVNLIYSNPAITETRSHIIEASAAACACDGGLCRLISMGKGDISRELGTKLIPLASEFTQHRLELRRGQGQAIAKSSASLAGRTLELLSEIRARM